MNELGLLEFRDIKHNHEFNKSYLFFENLNNRFLTFKIEKQYEKVKSHKNKCSKYGGF